MSQIEHLLQTAEAIRRDGKPEWMQVVGLVHDLGKLLYIFGSEWVSVVLYCDTRIDDLQVVFSEVNGMLLA